MQGPPKGVLGLLDEIGTKLGPSVIRVEMAFRQSCNNLCPGARGSRGSLWGRVLREGSGPGPSSAPDALHA